MPRFLVAAKTRRFNIGLMLGSVADVGPILPHHWVNVKYLLPAQQTRGIQPMPFQCWPTVFDAGPTLDSIG